MTEKEEQVKMSLNQIAKAIDDQLPEGFSFVMLGFEFGDEQGRKLLYVSNANREDITKAMKEWIEKANE